MSRRRTTYDGRGPPGFPLSFASFFFSPFFFIYIFFLFRVSAVGASGEARIPVLVRVWLSLMGRFRRDTQLQTMMTRRCPPLPTACDWCLMSTLLVLHTWPWLLEVVYHGTPYCLNFYIPRYAVLQVGMAGAR